MSHPDTSARDVLASLPGTPDEVRFTAGIRYFGTVLADPTSSPEELRSAYRSLLVLRRERNEARRRAALADLADVAADHRRRRSTVLSEFAALLPIQAGS